MLRITGRFCKIWEVNEIKDKIVKINLGTSDKQIDGTYKNSNWFNVAFVGGALEGAKRLKKGDLINIKNAKIENVFIKEKKQSYINIVVFDFELENNNKTVEENECPF